MIEKEDYYKHKHFHLKILITRHCNKFNYNYKDEITIQLGKCLSVDIIHCWSAVI